MFRFNVEFLEMSLLFDVSYSQLLTYDHMRESFLFRE